MTFIKIHFCVLHLRPGASRMLTTKVYGIFPIAPMRVTSSAHLFLFYFITLIMYDHYKLWSLRPRYGCIKSHSWRTPLLVSTQRGTVKVTKGPVNSTADRQSQKRTMKSLTLIKRHDTQHKSHRPCQLVCFTHQTKLDYYRDEWWYKHSAKVNRAGNIKSIELNNMQLVHVWIPNSLQLLQPHLPPNCDQVGTGRTHPPPPPPTNNKCNSFKIFNRDQLYPNIQTRTTWKRTAWSRIEQW